MRRRTMRTLVLTAAFALVLVLVAAGSTEPTCQPVQPDQPVCLTAHDCEGLVPDIDCVGEWTCVDAVCVFACGGGWQDLPTKQSPCTGGDPYGPDVSKVEVQVQGHDLLMRHRTVILNCCDVIGVQMDASQPGVLDLVETRTPESEPCKCMCTFDLEARVADLAPGTYALNVWSDGKAQLFASLTVTIPAVQPCAAPPDYAPVTPADLLAAPAAWQGMRISVDGTVSVGPAYCTMMYCGEANPCCNSCGAGYVLGDDANAGFEIAQGQIAPVGCSGNECTVLTKCPT